MTMVSKQVLNLVLSHKSYFEAKRYVNIVPETSGCLLRIDFDSLEAKEAVSILPYKVPN